ncbi:MAG: hypothetical protein AMK72_10455 [Planctomycetes bacterium SM23_25]|nr:MAG: hypothetical protein AMK72_10455 [Planctomycetes bacterium SM23_25]
MDGSLQIVQLVVQGGGTFALLLLAGCASARDHRAVVEQQGRASYWTLLRRGFFLYFLLAALIVGWLFEEGGVVVELSSALAGLVVGLSIALVSANHEVWLRRSLVSGLILIAADCFLEAFGRSYLGGLAGALLVGLAIGAGAGTLSIVASVVARRVGVRSGIWSLRIPALASLLLVAGGPALWLVVVAGTLFGFLGGARYQLNSGIPTRTAFLVSIAALAYAHAIYSFYFSFMSSYGIFSHPVVSVSPYALVSLTMGTLLHRIGGTS